MNPPIRITLLGQKSIVRNGLGHILATRNFDIHGSFDHVSQIDVDCADSDLLVIVDGGIDYGDTDDIELLHRRFPDLKLVVLSEHFDFDAMIRAFAAGVHGYLVKEMSFEPLVGSLRLIATGEKVMPTHLVKELALRASDDPGERARSTLAHAHLSAREIEILSGLMMGYPNKVISRRFSISEATVKVHVKSILRKLHVINRTQAAILAIAGDVDEPRSDVTDPENTVVDGTISHTA